MASAANVGYTRTKLRSQIIPSPVGQVPHKTTLSPNQFASSVRPHHPPHPPRLFSHLELSDPHSLASSIHAPTYDKVTKQALFISASPPVHQEDIHLDSNSESFDQDDPELVKAYKEDKNTSIYLAFQDVFDTPKLAQIVISYLSPEEFISFLDSNPHYRERCLELLDAKYHQSYVYTQDDGRLSPSSPTHRPGFRLQNNSIPQEKPTTDFIAIRDEQTGLFLHADTKAPITGTFDILASTSRFEETKYYLIPQKEIVDAKEEGREIGHASLAEKHNLRCPETQALFAGQPGEAMFVNGKLLTFLNSSGHFKTPDVSNDVKKAAEPVLLFGLDSRRFENYMNGSFDTEILEKVALFDSEALLKVLEACIKENPLYLPKQYNSKGYCFFSSKLAAHCEIQDVSNKKIKLVLAKLIEFSFNFETNTFNRTSINEDLLLEFAGVLGKRTR